MVAAGVGRSIEAKTNGVRRVYWISACDHYTSGETEVHIHIPGVSEHWLGVPSFDMVNVAGREWDDVKAELAAIGTLRQAESIIPPEQIKAFRSDEDSLMPLVFEGAYKDLLIVLSSHERRVEGLLPFLRRDYDERRILIAILMAAIDIASGAGDMVALSKRIESQVTGQYGVPEDYPNLAMLVGEFVTLFKEVPPAHWARVHGPVWARNETYEKSASAAVASHPRWPLVLSAELSIVMKWDHS
jgi:hypothetical protein